jgi:hypothetical protein
MASITNYKQSGKAKLFIPAVFSLLLSRVYLAFRKETLLAALLVTLTL